MGGAVGMAWVMGGAVVVGGAVGVAWAMGGAVGDWGCCGWWGGLWDLQTLFFVPGRSQDWG